MNGAGYGGIVVTVLRWAEDMNESASGASAVRAAAIASCRLTAVEHTSLWPIGRHFVKCCVVPCCLCALMCCFYSLPKWRMFSEFVGLVRPHRHNGCPYLWHALHPRYFTHSYLKKFIHSFANSLVYTHSQYPCVTFWAALRCLFIFPPSHMVNVFWSFFGKWRGIFFSGEALWIGFLTHQH